MSRVTVLMPVYNGARFLKQAIESVLAQTYEDFELLCIDDASSDQSAEIIESFHSPRIHYIRNEWNMGIAGTRNKGLDLIQSEYIALLDHDDLSPADRLYKEVAFLDQNAEIAAVGGNQKDIDETGKVVRETWRVCHNPKYLKAFIMLSNTMANGSAMIRKEFVVQNNLYFQENYCGIEDYRFWVDCSLKGNMANLDDVMLYWRTGHNQETSKAKTLKKGERERKIREVQEIALRGNGFCLKEEQLAILYKSFGEDAVLKSKDDIKLLYSALKEIAYQASILKLENQEEVAAMCRKRFGEKIMKAYFLW